MIETRQNKPMEPSILWHCVNALACAGLWLVSMMLSVGTIVALSPRIVLQSKLMGLIPLFLLVVLNFGAMLLASTRASRRTIKKCQPEAKVALQTESELFGE
jgi:cytochrome c-type biogenesis protein CcmH/NrfF